MIEHIVRDLRHAWRAMVRAPLVAAVVVLSLGVGIGVNTVVFSWIQALVFRPLPGVADASSFHLVETRAENRHAARLVVARVPRSCRRISARFPDLLAFRMVPLNVGEASRTERDLRAARVGQLFLRLSACSRRCGRFFRADEVMRPGAEPVVVISHDFWQTRFGGRATCSARRCASTTTISPSSASRRTAFRARCSACSSISGCRRRSRRCCSTDRASSRIAAFAATT